MDNHLLEVVRVWAQEVRIELAQVEPPKKKQDCQVCVRKRELEAAVLHTERRVLLRDARKVPTVEVRRRVRVRPDGGLSMSSIGRIRRILERI